MPKSFWDLTEPKWKGQLLMDDNESKWMAGMMQYYGEAKTMDVAQARGARHSVPHRPFVDPNPARRRRARRRGRRFCQRRRPFEKRRRADRLDRARAGHRSDLRPRRSSKTRPIPTPRVCSMIFSSRAKARKLTARPATTRRAPTSVRRFSKKRRQKPKSYPCPCPWRRATTNTFRPTGR